MKRALVTKEDFYQGTYAGLNNYQCSSISKQQPWYSGGSYTVPPDQVSLAALNCLLRRYQRKKRVTPLHGTLNLSCFRQDLVIAPRKGKDKKEHTWFIA